MYNVHVYTIHAKRSIRLGINADNHHYVCTQSHSSFFKVMCVKPWLSQCGTIKLHQAVKYMHTYVSMSVRNLCLLSMFDLNPKHFPPAQCTKCHSRNCTVIIIA